MPKLIAIPVNAVAVINQPDTINKLTPEITVNKAQKTPKKRRFF
jgi:hypothetical protein